MPRPLEQIDLTLRMSKSESLDRVAAAQKRLTTLRLFTAGLLDASTTGPGIIVLFEGFDAAGKGGSIRRVSAALDPRHARVVPIGPPTTEERNHHFLWRFQETLPQHGGMTIYDRSWYGRLLVERVEGLIDKETCKRSNTEIVEFERALVHDGAIIVKFWLQISAEEQLKRFERRQNDPLKHWKITPDDWENRKHRVDYEIAINDILVETDHPYAHWIVVPAESKPYARAFVLETLNRSIEKGLEKMGYEVPADVK